MASVKYNFWIHAFIESNEAVIKVYTYILGVNLVISITLHCSSLCSHNSVWVGTNNQSRIDLKLLPCSKNISRMTIFCFSSSPAQLRPLMTPVHLASPTQSTTSSVSPCGSWVDIQDADTSTPYG